MSDQQGLSIFDQRRSSAAPGNGSPPFPIIRRGGYDPDAVDARMREAKTGVDAEE